MKLVAVALMSLKSGQSKHGTSGLSLAYHAHHGCQLDVVLLVMMNAGLVPHAEASSGKLMAICVRRCSRSQWLKFLTRVSGPVRPT